MFLIVRSLIAMRLFFTVIAAVTLGATAQIDVVGN